MTFLSNHMSLWRGALTVPACALAALMLIAAPTHAEESAPTIAVFDFDFVDHVNSTRVMPLKEDTERVAALSALLRKKITESDRYRVIGVDPGQEKTDGTNCPPLCVGFERKVSKAMGAELWMGSLVARVSPLIHSITVTINDAATGEPVWGRSMEVRGNTEKAWSRGVRSILRNYLFAEPLE